MGNTDIGTHEVLCEDGQVRNAHVRPSGINSTSPKYEHARARVYVKGLTVPGFITYHNVGPLKGKRSFTANPASKYAKLAR